MGGMISNMVSQVADNAASVVSAAPPSPMPTVTPTPVAPQVGGKGGGAQVSSFTPPKDYSSMSYSDMLNPANNSYNPTPVQPSVPTTPTVNGGK